MKSSNIPTPVAAALRGLTRFSLLLVLGCIFFAGTVVAHGQQLLPPVMTYICTPNPAYIGVSAQCTVHVGGGATGTVTFYYGQPITAALPLDSNGDVVAQTGGLIQAPGTFLVQAVYSGDSQYYGATVQNAVTAYAGKSVVTTETLSCSPYILYVGNTASCKEYIPGGATGTVAFSVDGVAWSTPVSLTGGSAVLSGGLAGLAVGPHIVQTVYSGDANFAGFTTTTAVSISSTKVQPSAITVGCTPAPVALGASGSCLVRVKGGATGTVSLLVDNQSVGSPVSLDAHGSATVPNLFASSPAGSHSVIAVYSGDGNFGTATAATTVTVQNGESTPAMAVSCNPIVINVGQSASCTAQVSAGATGNVSFSVDDAPWTTVALNSRGAAVASDGLSSLPKGFHTVSATYAGDQNFTPQSGAVTVPVNQPTPPPVVTFNCSPTTVVAGNPVTCPVTVAGGATGAVELYVDGGNLVDGMGLDANGHAVFQNEFTGLSAGTHTVGLVFTGDLNFLAENVGGPTLTVANQATTPSFTAALTPTSIQSGGQFSLTAQVQSGATGAVSITINGQPFTELQINPKGSVVAGATVTLPSGTYPVMFNYLGDANFSPVSQTAMLTISSQSGTNPSDPGTTLTTPPAAGTLLYSYNITQASGSGYAPNGNIVAFNDSINGQWTAGYDGLNRLTSASQAPSGSSTSNVPAAQNFCWVYDSFGNRLLQARSPSSLSTCSTTAVSNENYVSASYTDSVNLNRVTSAAGELAAPGGSTPSSTFQADAAGNTTQDGVNYYSYDGEGRLCAVQNATWGNPKGYLYDAEGRRVAKGNINPPQGTDPCDLSTNNFTMTAEYVSGPDGEQLTEIDWSTGQSNWVHTNAFAGGQLVATYANDGEGVHLQLSDWLGTRRLQTDHLGNPEETCSGGSFGDDLNCVPVNNGMDATEIHFTGKERDSESGLDYFGARYYGSSMGRFTSPDDDSGEHADQPQSWNLYSYVQNNPLTNTDPDGHDCIDTSNFSTDGTVSVTRGDSCANNLGPNGTYVNGTIDTNSITASTNGSGTSFGYNFTSYDGQSGGAGVIAQAAPYGPLEGPANLAGANMIGNGGVAAINEFVKQAAIGAVAEGVGQAIGLGVDALRAARAAKAAEALAIAERVTQHAFAKHAGEFGNITRNEFQSLVQETMANPSEVRSLSNGRTAYWSDSQQMVVIENGTAPTQSTAFRPTAGKTYFDNMR